MLRIGRFLSATVLVAAFVTPRADAGLSATATRADIKITGASPNRQVAVCRFGEAYQGSLDWFVKQASVQIADAQGAVTVQAEQATIRSIWLVVDFATNTYAVASPAPRGWQWMPKNVIAQPETASVVVPNSIADVFVVRPPLGIWTAEGGDGRAGDDDGKLDGKVTFTLRNLTPVGSTPPGPAVLAPGDTVFIVQPGWMSYQVFQIPAGGGNAH